MLSSYLSQANFDMGSASLFFCLDASHSTAEPCGHSWNSSEQSCPGTANSMTIPKWGFQLPVGFVTWLQSPDQLKKFMTLPGPRNRFPLLTLVTCSNNVFHFPWLYLSCQSNKGSVLPFGGLIHGGSQHNHHHNYKMHTTDFLVPYVASPLPNLNSSCTKLGSSQFLNTSPTSFS